MGHDDEIVDAEIIDDDDLLPVHVGREVAATRSRELDDVSQDVDRLGIPEAMLALFGDPDVRAVPMDSAMRAQVRQALAFYWQNGPRQRSTIECQRAMERINDVEPSIGRCSTCRDTGHFYDRLNKRQVCSCPAALQLDHGS